MDNYGTWCVPRYGQLWYMVCPEVWTTMVHGVSRGMDNYGTWCVLRYGQLWYMVCPEVWTTMVYGVSRGMDNYGIWCVPRYGQLWYMVSRGMDNYGAWNVSLLWRQYWQKTGSSIHPPPPPPPPPPHPLSPPPPSPLTQQQNLYKYVWNRSLGLFTSGAENRNKKLCTLGKKIKPKIERGISREWYFYTSHLSSIGRYMTPGEQYLYENGNSCL